MAVRINRESISLKILRSKNVQYKAANLLDDKVNIATQSLLRDFDSHPVTKEIQAGPDLPSSTILPQGYGNLFSYLGFWRGERPIDPLRELLLQIRLIRTPRVQAKFWQFKIRIPSTQDIENATPMTWESGRSWVDAVTKGLGGFSHYMFSLSEGRFVASRSGTGIQVKSNLRASAEYFAGVGYIIGMLGNFRRMLGKQNISTK